MNEKEQKAYFDRHSGTINQVCNTYLSKHEIATGEIAVQIFVELLSLQDKKLPTQEEEVEAYAIAWILRKFKKELSVLYAARVKFPGRKAQWVKYTTDNLDDLPAPKIFEALHELSRLEQVVYSLAALDDHTPEQIASLFNRNEANVVVLIDTARSNLMKNLLSPS